MAGSGEGAENFETDAQIEGYRQKVMKDLRKTFEEEDRSLDSFAPGTPGCHEALHLSSVLLDTLDRHLLSHPAVIAEPAWFRLASRAHENLFALYQAIGATHLPAQSAAEDGNDKSGSA